MGLREMVQQNQMVAAAVAVLVIVLSALWSVRGGKPSPLPDSVYFYDLGTGELFPGDRSAQPPIDAPSGAGQGVKASVYACGKCADGRLLVAYLTTYSDAARAAMEKLSGADTTSVDVQLSKVIDAGTLVAAPMEGGGKVRWVSVFSEAGATAMGRTADLCEEDEKVTPCFPVAASR